MDERGEHGHGDGGGGCCVAMGLVVVGCWLVERISRAQLQPLPLTRRPACRRGRLLVGPHHHLPLLQHRIARQHRCIAPAPPTPAAPAPAAPALAARRRGRRRPLRHFCGAFFFWLDFSFSASSRPNQLPATLCYNSTTMLDFILVAERAGLNPPSRHACLRLVLALLKTYIDHAHA